MLRRDREPAEPSATSRRGATAPGVTHRPESAPRRSPDGQEQQPFALQVPQVALPKGGGAIKGIDEQFTVNAANGTMALSFALPFTPGRGGSTPPLRLAYDSGAGNGVVGLGWSIDLPSIGRRTDRGVPRYTDDDVFGDSAGDDLVPAARWDGGGWIDERSTVGTITVERFRPRIERRHDRIERITDRTDPVVPNVWWRVIDGNDVTTCFGLDASSRLADPADAGRVLRWLPRLSFDDLGNCTIFEYRADEDVAAPAASRHDANRRKGLAGFTNRHLVAVRYGNRVAYAADAANPYRPAMPTGDFHFHAVFDHGDHDADPAPTPAAGREWPGRADAFSSYRAGFEVRTQRLLRRVLMFHRFDELAGGTPTLVRSLDLDYRGDADVTLLASVTQRGYARRPDGTLSSRALPPVELEYQPLTWSAEVHVVDAADAADLPTIGGATQWLDLDGDGLVGALTEVEGAWYYRAGLGAAAADGGLRLGPPRTVEPLPSLRGIASGTATLVDLDADGAKQIVVRSAESDGYFERDGDGWLPWRPTPHGLRISLSEPHVRMLDLVGDGRTDVLVGDGDELVWYRSLGRRGFEPARRTPRAADEERSPAVVFGDDVQRVFLADMSGDGLVDIVRIRNGDVSYWPNLGHGRFGARVAMDGAPWFAADDAFHPERVRLADVTGTGTTDIVYLGVDGCVAHRNLSGNGWAPAQPLAGPPAAKGVDVSVTDVLGNGTPCLVWVSPLPADESRTLRYVDLMGGTKPYLLSAVRNNLGAERTIRYRTSSWFHLRDRAEGRPWATRLPFPVHCVETAAIADRVAGTTATTTYRYHHGTYDAVEREFRGFACVEQTTTDVRADWVRRADGALVDASVVQAPARVVTWFDTGTDDDRLDVARLDERWEAVVGRAGVDVDISPGMLGAATIEPAPGLPAEALVVGDGALHRQARRACRGTELRREVFGLDGSANAAIPYAVTTRASVAHVHQPELGARPAVVGCHEREVLTEHLEREAGDPRREHVVNVAFDEIGTVLTSAQVSYARRSQDLSLPTAVREAQSRTSVVATVVETTPDADSAVHHRLRRPWRTSVFEITGTTAAGALLLPTELAAAIAAATDLEPHEWAAPAPPAGTTRRRLLHRTIVDFFAADLRNAADPSTLDARGIERERYELAWTPALLAAVYGDRVTPAVLAEGGYVERDGGWWVPSGRWELLADGEVADAATARFHAHLAHVDAAGARTTLHHAGAGWLLVDEVRDAAGNTTRVDRFDWRVMQPTRVIDPNGNAAECVFDEGGWLVASATIGKAGALADDLTGLDGITAPTEAAAVATLLGASTADAVHGAAATLLSRATVRHVVDVDRHRSSGGLLPPVVATIVRERHATELADSPVQVSFEYSNGAGKVEMRKVQAEPGVARRAREMADGTVVVDEVDTAATQPPQLRWLGDGREVRNHRGNVVKAYEPFFSVTAHFETARELVESGVTKVQRFDPIDRLVRVDHPDGTFADVVTRTWSTVDRDRNDNVLRSTWHADRVGRRIDAALAAAGRDPAREEAAARQAEAHADTPRVRHLDPAGRPIADVVDAGPPTAGATHELLVTVDRLDVEGRRRWVTDPRGNVTMTYEYDLRGTLASFAGPDGGRRWMLDNVAGDPLRMWDERDHVVAMSYADPLHRLTAKRVTGGDGPAPLDATFERVVYGEVAADAGARNLRGRIAVHYDTAGRLEHTAFDVDGNLTGTRRRFATAYRDVPDWGGADPDAGLDAQVFTVDERADALGRIVLRTAPDGSVHEPRYNPANLLVGVRVTVGGQALEVLRDVRYDAQGRRRRVERGSGVVTSFTYAADDHRLVSLHSQRPDGTVLQDLHTTYDAEGNLTHLVDGCVPTTWFANAMVDGTSTYRYDSAYRLIEATGREHAGQVDFGPTDNWSDAAHLQRHDPNDALAWRAYTESYGWDPTGNLTRIVHAAGGGTADFTRTTRYEAGSNRIVDTTVGATSYPVAHQPRHGLITGLAHLPLMRWTFRDELAAVATQVVNAGTPETTWYVYDGDGNRVRKVTDRAAGNGSEPRRRFERWCFDGIEIEREYDVNDAVTRQRHTTHVMDDRDRIAMVERDATPGAVGVLLVRHQLGDMLGSPQVETDEGGRVISYELHHPFGTTAYQAVDKTIVAAAKRYRYTGMERDEETGLELHGARYYLPWLGRWASPDHHAERLDGNRYAYVKGNPAASTDRNGQYEEPVHGAATYRLALAAGFEPADAARIAIATAGMDHDAATSPGKSPDLMPQTKLYHFPTQEQALANVESDISGGVKDLEQLGRHLHSLEDVGFRNAPGPHMRSSDRLLTPLLATVGGFMLGASAGFLTGMIALAATGSADSALGMSLLLAGWIVSLAVGIFLVDFAAKAEGVGHPTYTSQHGDLSLSLNHVADQAYQDADDNTAVLNEVYKVLQRAADAHYGQCRRTDDAAAAQAIFDVTHADTLEKIDQYLNAPAAGAAGQAALPYTSVVDSYANGRWTREQIDATVHSWFIFDPSYEDWLKEQPVGVSR